MDYKEKYEQALSKARQFSENPLQEDSANIVEYIFPELTKDKDERIRKELIEAYEQSRKHNGGDCEWRTEITYDMVLAWLEKQASPVLSNSSNVGKNELNPCSNSWSEEDEVRINRIVACLENLNVADNDILLKDISWLKSLKSRIHDL